MTSHLHHMSCALRLAELGRFTVSPNPMVGCVIVKDDQVVAEAYHLQAGKAHAEALALREAGYAAKDATAYVTLEPCCHTGRTPPCTQALIEAGIKRIFVACVDPNPLMAGKSIKLLRAAGIEVQLGLLEAEATQLNEIFFHYIQYHRPFVIAKWAMSFDGKTITHPADTAQISSAHSKQHTHHTRQMVDAILIGANTARIDNPLLTARFPMEKQSKQPMRFILSHRGELPLDLRLFDVSLPAKTVVVTTAAVDRNFCQHLTAKKIEVLILPEKNEGRVNLSLLLDELGKREITSLLIEGGMSVHHQFFQEELVNKIQIYLSPSIIGSLDKKKKVSQIEWQQFGEDFYFTANYKEQ